MALMDVKTASLMAKKYLIDLFEDEGISNVGLEEVEFDELSNSWRITIGFSPAMGYQKRPDCYAG